MLEAKLSAAIASVMGVGKVFHDFAQRGTKAPWAVYQQVGGKSLVYVEQALPRERNGVFQVTVWAEKRPESVAKALQIEQALVSSPMQVTPVGAMRATYEQDTGLYGAMQDFSIWDTR